MKNVKSASENYFILTKQVTFCIATDLILTVSQCKQATVSSKTTIFGLKEHEHHKSRTIKQ